MCIRDSLHDRHEETTMTARFAPAPATPDVDDRPTGKGRRGGLLITHKIIGAVAIAVLAGLAVGVLGVVSLGASAGRTQQLYDQNTVGAQLAERASFQYTSF